MAKFIALWVIVALANLTLLADAEHRMEEPPFSQLREITREFGIGVGFHYEINKEWYIWYRAQKATGSMPECAGRRDQSRHCRSLQVKPGFKEIWILEEDGMVIIVHLETTGYVKDREPIRLTIKKTFEPCKRGYDYVKLKCRGARNGKKAKEKEEKAGEKPVLRKQQ